MVHIPSSKNVYTKPTRKPGRVDFKIEEINNLIIDQGIKVLVTPTLLCPNRDRVEGTNHVLDCPVCFGDEAVDLSDESYTADAVIQSITANKQFNVQGVFDPKDARMTITSNIRLYYWYKIEILDFASIYNEVIERGAGNEDKTRYKIFTGSCDVKPYLIDSLGNTYTKDTDYEFTEDKKIKWIGLSRPALGSLFSVSYPILPTFRVLETLHDNRFYLENRKEGMTPINLPQQAVIRWDFMASLSGNKELLGTT